MVGKLSFYQILLVTNPTRLSSLAVLRYIFSVHPLNNRSLENFREHFLPLLPNSTPQFLFTYLDQVRHHHVVLIDQSAWLSTWWTVEHWRNSKNNGLRTGALFFSFPRLVLRARVALCVKYHVHPAWLIKRLSCRLMTKWLGVIASRSWGSTLMRVSGWLVSRLSISAINVSKVSSFTSWPFRVMLRAFLADLTSLSQPPPKWGAEAGLKNHWILSCDRVSEILAWSIPSRHSLSSHSALMSSSTVKEPLMTFTCSLLWRQLVTNRNTQEVTHTKWVHKEVFFGSRNSWWTSELRPSQTSLLTSGSLSVGCWQIDWFRQQSSPCERTFGPLIHWLSWRRSWAERPLEQSSATLRRPGICRQVSGSDTSFISATQLETKVWNLVPCLLM